VQGVTEEITDRQLAAHAQHASTGLGSAEEQAMESLQDNEIKAAMQAFPNNSASR
jgi:RNA polymerase sigma-70 factor, ECF subfamily